MRVEFNKLHFLLGLSVLTIVFLYGIGIGLHGWPPLNQIRQFRVALGLVPAETHVVKGILERRELFRSLPGRADAVMLGDSLTEFGGSVWDEALPGFDVLNRGIGWDTADGVAERVDIMLQQRSPKAVFLMIGGNDLRRGRPPEHVAESVRNVLTSIRKAGALPILQSILLPARGGDPGPVHHLNSLLRNWCAENGIAFLDLNPALAPEGFLADEYTTDGVHLSWSGYARWVETWKPVALGALGTREGIKKG
jgi:lysophospholipase L1-like esterase